MVTLIKNGTILTMNPSDSIVERGAVAVENGRISFVGPERELPEGFSASKTIDAEGGAILPGFVNAHTHLAMTLLRGFGSDLNLQDWLEKKVWPAEDRLKPGDCHWGAMLGLAEMIRSGTTAFLDMYMFMDEIARAVEETGMRAVLSRGVVGVSPSYETAMAESEALFREFNGAADGRLTVMMAPHAEYTNDERSIRRILELAHKLGCGIHVHLQETVAETQACRERYGLSPAQWFEKIGLFSRHVVAAHCVTLDSGDIEILARHGASAAHNPGSNMKLASGIAPVPEMLEAGVNVALGTDGASSNNNLDMLEEARLAALLAKLRRGDPAALHAYDALKMATLGGAKALEIDNRAGSIEVGKDADIIVISGNPPSMHPRTDIVSNIVYSAGSTDVTMTMVKGRVLMERSRLVGLDLEKICREADSVSERICI